MVSWVNVKLTQSFCAVFLHTFSNRAEKEARATQHFPSAQNRFKPILAAVNMQNPKSFIYFLCWIKADKLLLKSGLV
jgi:hypothetical protein